MDFEVSREPHRGIVALKSLYTPLDMWPPRRMRRRWLARRQRTNTMNATAVTPTLLLWLRLRLPSPSSGNTYNLSFLAEVAENPEKAERIRAQGIKRVETQRRDLGLQELEREDISRAEAERGVPEGQCLRSRSTSGEKSRARRPRGQSMHHRHHMLNRIYH
ncbi:hypothetical protein CONLIGDRAFT_687679 [Coniochaeta ligniaria NRRL 30616]|uniref:Uncharacterized protein n=1 Tax=Coniochaeta ligniaria NRRL 30616 TaxID=1408157 RepID=A0A1J7I3T9_9PEZI|nr:hypothetical protein CONLIGDRAFT_687679 [Coniochaeta ligniaria NRRL 30616]